MKTPSLRTLLAVGAAGVLALSARAQVIELRATINGAQENPAVNTPAEGNAVMLYDVGTNTFDLIISITGLTNTVTASHIHEGAVGSNGPVATNLGGEAVYTRSGTTLTATFRNVAHSGDRLRLIQGGAYFNLHTAANPGGEVRGQLIARPVRLVANLDVAQEAAAFPALNFSAVNNFGAAVVIYDPTANTVSLRHSLFNYSSTFTNSHIHTGAPGVSGGVNTQLGTNANAGAYNTANGHISGSHEAVTYGGNPVELLTGLNYLNYHSQAFAGGQLRGQLTVSRETLNTRLGNLAVRGFVGAGEQVLIGGISVQGTEPVRVLIAAKGPSLAAFGVTGAIPNPRLALFSGTTQIAVNDDVGALVANSELSRIPAVPTNPLESALVVVLPPGNYTAQVSSSAGTGVALLEVYDLRNVPTALAIASLDPVSPKGDAPRAIAAAGARPAPEFCVTTPLPAAVATR
ncbi:MAG: CHRD domain-containing protein [Opitutaceae bacterium]|nr:CHRD domain-containing protein [Opitutaceae bacterium]